MKPNKNIVITLFLFILFSAISFASFCQHVDEFAAIGNKVPAIRTHLLEVPQPPVLDSVSLPLEKGNRFSFKPTNKLDTKEELDTELEKMRKEYAPFMKNYAPGLKSQRTRLNLETFNWRIETKADQQNFSSLLQGKGNWTEVAIPHFGEPLGEATTYYYKEFELGEELLTNESLFICFKGVDYKADVFINGYYLGSHEGFFAPFEFDFTKVGTPGVNRLLVKVTNHEVGAKGEKIYAATGPGYDEPTKGWHHCPAGMGIYQDVFIEGRSHLHVNDLFVRPVLDDQIAELWIEVNNTSYEKENIQLEYSIYGQNFKDTVCRQIVYTPSSVVVPGLGDLAKSSDGKHIQLSMAFGSNFLKIPVHIPNPKVWDNKTPWLYQLQVRVLSENGEVQDVMSEQFGMRSFSMDTISIPKGTMYLNGQPVRLRGANTMGHLQGCVMRKDWDQLRDDILLAKICNMNFIRLTQRPVQPEIYDYCDQLGIMTQTDLPLFGFLRRTKFAEAVKQAEEMERLVRSHPCNVVVSYINERFPNANGQPQRCFAEYADYEKFYTAASQSVLITNPDRVIKPGDGDYDPPSPGLPDSHCYNMWYNGHGLGVGEMYKGCWQPVKPNWNYACGEYGAEDLDPLNTMEKYYPENWLEEDNGHWLPNNIYKAQTPAFHIMWYDAQDTKKKWIEASQNHQALMAKWMTEAFRRDSRMVSTAIHLFIDAWPAGWMKSIMDVDRQPKKAFFEYRNALTPLMVSLRSDRSKFFSEEQFAIEAWICNDKNTAETGVFLNYQVEQQNKVIASGKMNAKVPLNSSKFQGFVNWQTPRVSKRTSYILRIALMNSSNQLIHENEFEFEVFPNINTHAKKVFVAGEKSELVNEIVQGLNLEYSDAQSCDLVLVDGNYFSKNEIKGLDSLVSERKKMLILNLPAGEYTVGNSDISIIPTFMGNYYFVSTQTTHSLTKDFQEGDFRFWYDSEKDLISPILSSMIDANGWDTILKTGIGKRENNLGSVDFYAAVATRKIGKGEIIVSQLDFNNKIEHNPIAKEFLQNLIK